MCILSVGIPVVIRRTFVPSPIHHFPAHASSESPIYTLHALASLPRPCDRFGDQRRENLLSEIHTSATLLLIALSLACLLSLSPFRPPFFLVPSFVCLFFSFGTFSFPFFFFFFCLVLSFHSGCFLSQVSVSVSCCSALGVIASGATFKITFMTANLLKHEQQHRGARNGSNTDQDPMPITANQDECGAMLVQT